MKGRYLRDCSMPCSPQHFLGVEDECQLKIARSLLKLSMRLCYLCSVEETSEEYTLLATDLLEISLYTNPKHFSQPCIF